MKYAIVTAMDQTIGYATSPEGEETTKHPDAMLWDDVHEASHVAAVLTAKQVVYLKNGGHPRYPTNLTDEQIVQRSAHLLEAVEDEEEFRAREDTW